MSLFSLRNGQKILYRKEWHQHFLDDFMAHGCIDKDLPIPEDAEIRLLKAMSKINLCAAEKKKRANIVISGGSDKDITSSAY